MTDIVKTINRYLAGDKEDYKAVGYMAYIDGKPCWDADSVCVDAVWPAGPDDDRVSVPIYVCEQLAAYKTFGWAISGVNRIYIGECAESEARDDAKRCGGTCEAFALYVKNGSTQNTGWRL